MATKNPTAPTSLGRELNFAAGAGNAVVARLLAPYDLSLAQWAVLQTLWRNGPLKLVEIARLTGNAAPATSRLVDRMVDAGLVTRSEVPQDRRTVTVAVAPRGEELRHLQDIYQQVNAVLMRDLTPEDADRLFNLLARVERAGRDWLDQTGAG
ncbi:MarR family winged helix-turn-helix transcriptional regulator [Roseinatronobacter ekhonensis]|jgi:DNA-binding MarR family transcriptional regulator|nr:MarR family transcriptional regulator [Roseibaca ekhonensis]